MFNSWRHRRYKTVAIVTPYHPTDADPIQRRANKTQTFVSSSGTEKNLNIIHSNEARRNKSDITGTWH